MKKQEEVKVVEKVYDFILGLYPHIIDKAKKKFDSLGMDFPNNVSYSRGFNSWFLLKYIVHNAATPMELAYSFPMDYFSKKEKRIIKNFIGHIESLFEVISIKDKDYTLKDARDNKKYNMKTIAMDGNLKAKDYILATIVKSLKNCFFFYGNVLPCDKMHIEDIKKELKNSSKEKNKLPEIE